MKNIILFFLLLTVTSFAPSLASAQSFGSVPTSKTALQVLLNSLLQELAVLEKEYAQLVKNSSSSFVGVVTSTANIQITQSLPFGFVAGATTTPSPSCIVPPMIDAAAYNNNGLPYMSSTSTIQTSLLGQGMNTPMTLYLQPDKDTVYVTRQVNISQPIYGNLILVSSTVVIPESWIYTGVGINQGGFPIQGYVFGLTNQFGWQPSTSTPVFDNTTSSLVANESGYSADCTTAIFNIPNPSTREQYYMFIDGGGLSKQYAGTLNIQ